MAAADLKLIAHLDEEQNRHAGRCVRALPGHCLSADAVVRARVVVNPLRCLLREIISESITERDIRRDVRADSVKIRLGAKRANGVPRHVARREFLRPEARTEVHLFVAQKDIRRGAGLVVAQVEHPMSERVRRADIHVAVHVKARVEFDQGVGRRTINSCQNVERTRVGDDRHGDRVGEIREIATAHHAAVQVHAAAHLVRVIRIEPGIAVLAVLAKQRHARHDPAILHQHDDVAARHHAGGVGERVIDTTRLRPLIGVADVAPAGDLELNGAAARPECLPADEYFAVHWIRITRAGLGIDKTACG